MLKGDCDHTVVTKERENYYHTVVARKRIKTWRPGFNGFNVAL
jgi:hypothetical protein